MTNAKKKNTYHVCIRIQGSVQFSCSVMSDSLRPHGPQYTRIPCPLPTPRACSNSCPSSQSCHPTISSFVIPFSSHLQTFPASGSFPMSQFFTSGGQSIGVSASASVLPMNIHDWIQGYTRHYEGVPSVRTSLVVQQIRICLPMQGARV